MNRALCRLQRDAPLGSELENHLRLVSLHDQRGISLRVVILPSCGVVWNAVSVESLSILRHILCVKGDREVHEGVELLHVTQLFVEMSFDFGSAQTSRSDVAETLTQCNPKPLPGSCNRRSPRLERRDRPAAGI